VEQPPDDPVKGNPEDQGQDHQEHGEQEDDLRSEDTTSLKNFRVNEIGKRRKYLKEIIISHSLWQEGRFWEQALWQCVLEQVPCPPPLTCSLLVSRIDTPPSPSSRSSR
jgi:hypothetical protein